jgi:hypothetical protein
LPDFLRFGFRRKFDDDEIAHDGFSYCNELFSRSKLRVFSGSVAGRVRVVAARLAVITGCRSTGRGSPDGCSAVRCAAIPGAADRPRRAVQGNVIPERYSGNLFHSLRGIMAQLTAHARIWIRANVLATNAVHAVRIR